MNYFNYTGLVSRACVCVCVRACACAHQVCRYTICTTWMSWVHVSRLVACRCFL